MVKKLIEAKGDINEKNKNGETALHIAAYSGSAEVIKFLLENFDFDIEAESKQEIPPLIYAIHQQHQSCVKILLNHQANINHHSSVRTHHSPPNHHSFFLNILLIPIFFTKIVSSMFEKVRKVLK